jgi:hypothetical protein
LPNATSRIIHAPSPVPGTSRSNHQIKSNQIFPTNPALRSMHHHIPPLQLKQAPCFGQKRPHPSSTDVHGIKYARPCPQPMHPDYNKGFHPECDADFSAFYGDPTDEEMEAMHEPESQW